MFDCTRESGHRYQRDNTNDRDDQAHQWVSWFTEYTFEFNSRETYLEFRRWWREQYLRISQEIRTTRSELKEKARAGKYVGNEEQLLHAQRENARRMMGAIEGAKKEAARQVEAGRKAA